jgi:hypothetical protein
LALMTKPVPVLLTVFPARGVAPGVSAPAWAGGFAAAAFGPEKSPALLMPSALILLTQLAIAASSGPVEVRLN